MFYFKENVWFHFFSLECQSFYWTCVRWISDERISVLYMWYKKTANVCIRKRTRNTVVIDEISVWACSAVSVPWELYAFQLIGDVPVICPLATLKSLISPLCSAALLLEWIKWVLLNSGHKKQRLAPSLYLMTVTSDYENIHLHLNHW